MSKEKLFEQLIELIDAEKRAQLAITMNTEIASFAEDSVELMEFVVTVEDVFGVEIPDEAIESFTSVSDLVDYIAEQK
ncbi:phosphopantetheine-binding protein [Streptococcus gallinaceus]|uniref:Acyl carrier protein n=1 Tax=Streptococcus gallinaceus TaxID=165758 RepID=A0ABV2JN12_9STRE|nr:phosphopantetheine-binding protein [Streptococcus gallinaceus]MCP1640364.1 acyl carrier protein [Streptococcus gallinaceus]MCP1771147.1 acyl carrier protein [Streptococcus gallinaceus]